MTNKATKITIILLAAILFFSFASCSKKSGDDTIKIGVLEGPSVVSFIQLIDQDYTIDNKKVEIIIKNEPFQIQAMMMKQELDFAVLPTVMAANLYNKGVKYRMVACPIWGTLYMISNNPDITCYTDLNGKEIAVFGQGSTADLLLQYNLKSQNTNCKNIDYRFKTNQEVAQALLMKEIETAVVSEPLASLILHQDSTLRIVRQLTIDKFDEAPERNIFVQSAFMVSDRFIKNHSYAISDVSNAYANSCNYVNANPEVVAEKMVKHQLATDINIASSSVGLCNINYVSGFALQRELFYYLQIFNETNPESIGGKLPKPDFVYHSYK